MPTLGASAEAGTAYGVANVRCSIVTPSHRPSIAMFPCRRRPLASGSDRSMRMTGFSAAAGPYRPMTTSVPRTFSVSVTG